MDFGALPPEINSGRIYAGPGAGSLTAAAQAWQTLAVELEQTATSYRSVLAGVAAAWHGPSATAMTAAAAPYTAWLETTAGHASRTAAQVGAAAAAFTTALAATVPPMEVAANRAQLLALIASNVFGQNAPAIAANEAQYAAMWAQDTAAMNTYAAASQATTAALPQFTNAPQTAQPLAAQPAAALLGGIFGNSGPLSSSALLGQYIQAIIQSGIIQDIPLAFMALFQGITAEETIRIADEGAAVHAMPPAPVVVSPPAAAGAAPMEAPAPVAAASGAASQLGRLSVPPSWAQPPQPARNPVRPIEAHVSGNPKAAIPAVPFMPVASAGRSAQGKVREEPEYGHVSRVMPPRHPAGG